MKLIGRIPDRHTPDGFYMQYFWNFDGFYGNTIRCTDIIMIRDNIAYYFQNNEFIPSYRLTSAPDLVGEQFELYEMNEKEVAKHVILEVL